LRRPRTLAVSETYPKVKAFLNSKSRNSLQTQKVYSFALSHFQTFLQSEGYNIENVLSSIENKEINIYSLLDKFVSYLSERQDSSNSNTKLSPSSILLYVAGVRSYLEYYDLEISSKRFQRKVTLPKKYKRIKEGLDPEDIRTILQSCTNYRLRMFLLLLASSGMRSMEALSLKTNDIDFNSNPTKIHVRAEYSKTKQSRDIYISDECSNELKKYIEQKADKMSTFNDLIFGKRGETKPMSIYRKLLEHFHKVLEKVDKDKRKDGQGIQRRELTFHSFRTFVKTVISTQTSDSFSEYILGHSYSTYWSMKEPQRRELYLKCMPFLTFLDYGTVQSIGKDYESKLKERDQEVEILRQNFRNMFMKLREIEQKYERNRND
jgi:integrase